MTEYELARLRLQAFGLMDDWGSYNETGIFVPYDLPKRKEMATYLVEWAAGITLEGKSE